MLYQNGGLLKNIKPTDFKYTLNEQRRIWIMNMYPNADIFLNSVIEIPFNKYTYDGPCEYTITESSSSFNPNKKNTSNNNEIVIRNINTLSNPTYWIAGGCVYELLTRYYKNVDLYEYCDPTGDIDVTLYPPKITTSIIDDVYFMNNEKINTFYDNFIKWVLYNLIENLKTHESQLDELFPNLVDFDINEYEDIPNKNKNNDLGYSVTKMGKLFIVSFLNDTNSMFKIQIVCKINDQSILVIDHVTEIIIALPEDSIFYSPSSDDYGDHSNNYTTLIFSDTSKINIQSFNTLINDNVSAYIERIESYNNNEFMHKAINHVARIFYLFELFYKNLDIIDIKKIYQIYLYNDLVKKKIFHFLYYIIENNNFKKINVDIKIFLNAYMELFMLKTNPTKPIMSYNYNICIKKYPDLFNISNDVQVYKNKHDEFITTFIKPIVTAGGKNRKRKTKRNNRKQTKRNNIKQTKRNNRKQTKK
jgi:hypothetical protein